MRDGHSPKPSISKQSDGSGKEWNGLGTARICDSTDLMRRWSPGVTVLLAFDAITASRCEVRGQER